MECRIVHCPIRDLPAYTKAMHAAPKGWIGAVGPPLELFSTPHPAPDRDIDRRTDVHTPGPWTATPRKCPPMGEAGPLEFSIDTDASGVYPGSLVVGWYDTAGMEHVEPGSWRAELETARANARLMAAAPELLDALVAAERCGHFDDTGCDGVYQQIIAAIAAAKGE